MLFQCGVRYIQNWCNNDWNSKNYY